MPTWLILASGGGGEDTPSVLQVPPQEFVIGLIAFLVVFGLLAKVALPRIKRTLEERADAIEGGIKRAEEAQSESTRLLEDYRAQLAGAREEASAIRTQAQADRAAIIEEARAEARAAAASVTAQAEAQLAAERAQAMSQLTRQVGEVAVALAGKVVGQSLTDDARISATVDSFLADLEAKAEAAR